MERFASVLAAFKTEYGELALPPARSPFEHVLWENACYLLSDERRAAVFEALRERVGLTPEAIRKAPDEVLLPLARQGGMRPEVRVFRWREIARIAIARHGGDLGSILQLPFAQAAKTLREFPCIGGPGAEKILLFCGAVPGRSTSGDAALPLESNGLRVLTRIGYGRAQKSYGATYKSVQEALQRELPKTAGKLTQAHLLLREHGRTLCKDKTPRCPACPVSELCAWAANEKAKFLRPIS